jgi:hypothetical protein
MLVQFSGQATTFGVIEPGMCFAFERDGRPHIGFKVRDEAGGGDSCVAVWAEGGDGPALLPEAPPGDCPVLSLPDAMFQPAPDPAHIQTEGTGQREAGQLLLAGRGSLAAGRRRGRRHGADRPQVGCPHPRRPRRHPHPVPGLAHRAEGTRRRVRHDLPACGEAAVEGGVCAGLA